MNERPLSSGSDAFDRLHVKLGNYIGQYCQSTKIRFENAREAVVTVVIDSNLDDLPWSSALRQTLAESTESSPIDQGLLKQAIIEEVALLYSETVTRTRIMDVLKRKGVL